MSSLHWHNRSIITEPILSSGPCETWNLSGPLIVKSSQELFLPEFLQQSYLIWFLLMTHLYKVTLYNPKSHHFISAIGYLKLGFLPNPFKNILHTQIFSEMKRISWVMGEKVACSMKTISIPNQAPRFTERAGQVPVSPQWEESPITTSMLL